jgi:hypothetical protein
MKIVLSDQLRIRKKKERKKKVQLIRTDAETAPPEFREN